MKFFRNLMSYNEDLKKEVASIEKRIKQYEEGLCLSEGRDIHLKLHSLRENENQNALSKKEMEKLQIYFDEKHQKIVNQSLCK